MAERSPRKLAKDLIAEIADYKKRKNIVTNVNRMLTPRLEEIMYSHALPEELTVEPSPLTEAMVIAQYSFFSGKFQEVAYGNPLHDLRMKDLMVESSQIMADWLTIRNILEGDKAYFMMVNYCASVLPQVQPFTIQAEGTETPYYLTKMREELDTRVPETDEEFRAFIIGVLDVAARTGSRPSNAELRGKPSRKKIANVLTADSFRNTDFLDGMHDGSIEVNPETIDCLKAETGVQLKNWLILMDKLGRSSFFSLITSVYHNQHCKYWQQ